MLTALAHVAIAQSCVPGRDCNAPESYQSRKVTTDGSNAPTYWESTNFDATLKAGFVAGVDAARSFIGSASDVGAIFLENGGSSTAVYETARAAFCTLIGRTDAQCLTQDVTKAMAAGGTYYMTSGPAVCQSCSYVSGAVGLVTVPEASSTGNDLYDRAVHEYTHAVQAAMGGPLPNWLMEGGAVLNECILGSAKVSPYTPKTTSACLKFEIISNTIDLYTNGDGGSLPGTTEFLTLYGSDRPCGTDIPAYQKTHPFDEQAGGRKLWYDTGAVAILYAVYKANINHATDGGRTIIDFWTGTGTRGFWHAITPYAVDPVTGWADDVPEGQGWKKAFSDFTGFATVAAFYTDFEAAIRPNGAPINEAGILAWATSDAAYTAAAGTAASFATRDPTPYPACNAPGDAPGDASSASTSTVATMAFATAGLVLFILA